MCFVGLKYIPLVHIGLKIKEERSVSINVTHIKPIFDGQNYKNDGYFYPHLHNAHVRYTRSIGLKSI